MAATEAKVRERAEAAGWTLDKQGKAYRLVDVNGTVIAGDWSAPGFYGLTLEEVDAVLADNGTA